MGALRFKTEEDGEFLSNDKIYAIGGSFMMKGDIVENCKKINEIVNKLN